jgi:ribokinase
LVLQVPRFPQPGETLTGGDLELHPGGKGANQACAAARLGGRVCFVGCVGQDVFGPQLIVSLREAGVDVSHVHSVSRSTGFASIYVDHAGRNSIVISPGANAEVTAEHVGTALSNITSDDYVLLQLEIPLAVVESTVELTKSVGATCILDPAPARELKPSLLQSVSYITPNQTEASILLGQSSPNWTDGGEITKAALNLQSRGPRSVILKLGEQGCYLQSGATGTRVEGFPVHAVDSTAAGDVFNGALAVALSEGRPAAAACVFANAAAALSVTRPGAQSSIPTRNEVTAFLRASARAESL